MCFYLSEKLLYDVLDFGFAVYERGHGGGEGLHRVVEHVGVVRQQCDHLQKTLCCKSQLCFVNLIKIVEIYMYIYCIHLPVHRIENPMW